MKVLVCGGRAYSDRRKVFFCLDAIHSLRRIQVLVHGDCWSGGASLSADRLADDWARTKGVDVVRYPADWDRYGKYAGPIRNKEMIKQNPDIELVVAFPGGNGTKDMVTKARKAGIRVIEVAP